MKKCLTLRPDTVTAHCNRTLWRVYTPPHPFQVRRASAKASEPSKLESSGRCWPAPREIFLFRLAMAVFPVTDFKHPVLTPAMILIGQYLSQSPVRGPRDAIAGVLLSGIALSGVRPSGRIFPEAVTFLHGIVAHACRYMLICLYMMLIGLYVKGPYHRYSKAHVVCALLLMAAAV